MNSWLQTACQPNSRWYGSTRSAMNRRPRSRRPQRRGDLAGVLGRRTPRAARRRRGPRSSSARAPRSSPSCGRTPSSGAVRAAPRRRAPRVFSITARRFSVADSWAKLSIQWIFQWRSWMSIASSSRHGHVGQVHRRRRRRGAPRGTRSCAPSPGAAGRATSRRSRGRRPAARCRGRRPSSSRRPRRAAPGRRSASCTRSPSMRRSGIGRDGRRVDVAVDVLGQPVDRERRPEPAEHVVAAQPPAADVEEHRADRVRECRSS